MTSNFPFDLVETKNGDIMISIPEQSEKDYSLIHAKFQQDALSLIYNNEDILQLSPFPLTQFKKISSNNSILISEFNDNGLVRAYYANIVI